MNSVRQGGLLIAPAMALMLAACGNSGSHTQKDLGVDVRGTIVGVDSHDYVCTVGTDWTNAKPPIEAIGAGINSRNGWTITVTKGASYVFEATCSDRSGGTLPPASGSSAKVKATVAQSHRNVVIRVHVKS